MFTHKVVLVKFLSPKLTRKSGLSVIWILNVAKNLLRLMSRHQWKLPLASAQTATKKIHITSSYVGSVTMGWKSSRKTCNVNHYSLSAWQAGFSEVNFYVFLDLLESEIELIH